MPQFPVVDPIPPPAPIWLLKTLHNLTLALHLTSVELLLGGLLLGLAFAAWGRLRGSAEPVQAAGMMVHRLPTLMAFVINLGVPPLLFAQVLYGRALYTSSVLIGAYWISVILLLMASYYGLYAAAKRANEQQSWALPGLAALVLVLTIAFIYSNNMTLMLRPAEWVSMYRGSPSGVQLNQSDPTLFPRWFFFLTGAFPATGAVLCLLALRSDVHAATSRFLTRSGGVAMAAGILLQSYLAYTAIGAQPNGVVSGVMANAVYQASVYGWVATAGLILVAGLIAAAFRKANWAVAIACALAVFLNVASTVMVRDGIRDVTLRAAGFDVWNREVVSNWSVIAIFVVLFVAALAVLGYLGVVVAKARRIEEKYV